VEAPSPDEPLAWFGGWLATGLEEVTHDLRRLDAAGWWAVVATFEGRVTAARFRDVREAPLPSLTWVADGVGPWQTSLDQTSYEAAVGRVRALIAAGEVYQVNVCRVLSAHCPPDADVVGLAGVLARGNPAPYGGVVRLPAHDVHVVSASPELFLRRAGDLLESGPIKGTGRTAADLSAKDRAENVMITDLVRNDLGAVAVTGSVSVPDLCVVEAHPGLVHLVSRVRAVLRPGVGWTDIFAAAFPPGSVSGAPKSSALRIIGELEPVERGPYCGAVGWVDADRRTASLAVGIRSFWLEASRLRFGTGAGITWGSDPTREWDETELKAARLLGLAGVSGRISS
ncbi:MAG: chorismate-binding protein, partial [Actinomycetes bacterium]